MEDTACCVCYEDVVGNKGVCSCGTCGHMFHEDCYTRWLSRSMTCPYCTTPKERIVNNPEPPQHMLSEVHIHLHIGQDDFAGILSRLLLSAVQSTTEDPPQEES